MSVLLLQGDARQIPLLDGSVHCVVTSPPYYGLRDYATGAWYGGDPACLHSPADTPQQRGLASSTLGGGKGTTGHQREGFRGTCPRCGAVRVDAQIGLEKQADCLAWARQEPPCAACWVCAMRAVFAEVHRVLVPTGVMFVNVGDAYTSGNRVGHGTRVGYKQQTNRGMNGTSDPPRAPQPPGLREKNLLGLPWRLALALQADGFILRSEIIWHKLNPMPESVQDRPTRAHEQVFLFSKQGRYYFDMEAIREPATMRPQARLTPQPRRERQHAADGWAEPRLLRETPMLDGNPTGRAMRSVLSLASEPLSMSHFATFPTALVRRCLLAGAPSAVCRECGAPWVRDISATYTPSTRGTVGKMIERNGEHITPMAGLPRMNKYVTTTGFSPACTCTAPTQPATVFDPFCGSGTVPLVARELGHHGVGLDLSYAYLHDIARERLDLARLARWSGQATPDATREYTDLPLFALTEDTP